MHSDSERLLLQQQSYDSELGCGATAASLFVVAASLICDPSSAHFEKAQLARLVRESQQHLERV